MPLHLSGDLSTEQQSRIGVAPAYLHIQSGDSGHPVQHPIDGPQTYSEELIADTMPSSNTSKEWYTHTATPQGKTYSSIQVEDTLVKQSESAVRYLCIPSGGNERDFPIEFQDRAVVHHEATGLSEDTIPSGYGVSQIILCTNESHYFESVLLQRSGVRCCSNSNQRDPAPATLHKIWQNGPGL